MKEVQLHASDAAIEAAYPLSPMQRDMLLHSMSSPASGAYVQHAICDLRERLEPSLLERAWQRVVERHSILRTAFCIEAAGEPIQQVHRHVDVPWTHFDWHSAQSAEQETRFDAYLDADRWRDFALERPAPMRIALFQLGDAHFRFLLTYHHALLDGRSVRIVLRELFDLYDALAAGRDVELPPAHPYREYVDWLARQDSAAAEAFWRNALEGFVAPPRLPESRARSTDEGRNDYASAELRVSPKAADTLRSFARDHDLTLNTLLLAAWARVLARYSGEADVAFDTTLALRGTRTDGLREVVGLCINTVPMRVRVESEMPLLPWLERVRAGWIAMRPHAWMPLASIHRCGGARGAQLMSSLVVYEHTLLGPLLREDRESWTTREFSRRSGASHPLTLVAFGEPDLLLKLVYAQSRFDPAMIESMLEHLSTALEGATSNPQKPVREQPLLTEAETRRILVEWNDTRREFPLEHCVHELFAEQAARAPYAIAVEAAESRLTYRELDERANQLAHYLQRSRVAPGALVGLCLPRTPELIIALLGILKAGAAYLPLDANHPPERLEHILRDAGVSALIATETLALRLRRVAGRMIPIEGDRKEIARESSSNPGVGVGAEDSAYVIYTSGSTGQPKGILVPHRAVTNHTLALVEYYRISPADRRLQFVSISSDALIADVFPPLVSGATIVLRPDSELLSVTDFLRFLEDRRITITGIPSAYWHEWVSAMASGEAMPFPSSLRVVISGMDSVRPDLFAAWRPQARGRVRWFNSYGPSENTCTATIYEADLSSDTMLDTIPIGRPIANVRVYILDANGEPVPVGVPGEIYLGGRSVARGYLKRPDLTAERFVRDPFSGNPEDRLYRTGDLARYLPDGNIAFLGRVDNQIKIRGYRVEPAEVEAAVRRLAGVREAIVVARGGASDARKLVAYVVANAPRPTAEDLRAQLRRTLPDYMVPAAIVLLDALPLSPNGKIDYAALPEPELGVGQPTGEHAAPRDDLEKTLATIWQDLLRVPQIGLRDNFFDSGGDSLLAVRMIDVVKRTCGVGVAPAAFLAEPTIEGLAASVRGAVERGGGEKTRSRAR
jgi:amino acid adenylation domain-containing protein